MLPGLAVLKIKHILVADVGVSASYNVRELLTELGNMHRSFWENVPVRNPSPKYSVRQTSLSSEGLQFLAANIFVRQMKVGGRFAATTKCVQSFSADCQIDPCRRADELFFARLGITDVEILLYSLCWSIPSVHGTGVKDEIHSCLWCRAINDIVEFHTLKRNIGSLSDLHRSAVNAQLRHSYESVNGSGDYRSPCSGPDNPLDAEILFVFGTSLFFCCICKPDLMGNRFSIVLPCLFVCFCCCVYSGTEIVKYFLDRFESLDNCSKQGISVWSHRGITVPHEYILTTSNYWGTVIVIGDTSMANVLSTEKQTQIIGSLAEGSSIRSIERQTGVHRDTIMRLGVRIGKGCATLMDQTMRNLPCQHLQFDEIWGFVGKKQKHVNPADDDPTLGDVWTFCAIDSETKLVPSFKCGKRDHATANAFVADVKSRMRNRVQISCDALREYVWAIEQSFGSDVDFAQIVKTYVHDDGVHPERQYSPSEIVITKKKRIAGFPDMRKASTSHIERLNGTTRLHMRRLTRLTYAFSKKFENFEAAAALHFTYYNFVKRHNTLRITPAMAAGVSNDFWTVAELVKVAA